LIFQALLFLILIIFFQTINISMSNKQTTWVIQVNINIYAAVAIMNTTNIHNIVNTSIFV
jgi:hypothetical protein